MNRTYKNRGRQPMPPARLPVEFPPRRAPGRRKQVRGPAGCKGFSLIEIAIATIIIGLGVTALLMTLTAGTKVNDASQNRTQAAFLAQEIREWTLRLPFDNLSAMNNVTYNPPRDGQGNAITNLTGWGQTITMTWRNPANIASVVTNGSSDMVYIQVAVAKQSQTILTTGWLVSKRST